jgi:hypothetical protein
MGIVFLSVSMASCVYANSYIPPSSIFTRNLHMGSSGNDVKTLQQFLNDNGFIVSQSGAGSLGKETSVFGNMTKSALARFQEANASTILSPQGLKNGTGALGLYTRSFINDLVSTSSVSDSNDNLQTVTYINGKSFYKTDPGNGAGYLETTAGWVKITGGVTESNPIPQTNTDASNVSSTPAGPPQMVVSYATSTDGTFSDYVTLASGDTIPDVITYGEKVSIRIDNIGQGPLTTSTTSPVSVLESPPDTNTWDIPEPQFPIAAGGNQEVTLSSDDGYNHATNTFTIMTNDPTNPEFSVIVDTNS